MPAGERWRESLHAATTLARRLLGGAAHTEARRLAALCHRVRPRALRLTPVAQARFVVVDLEATGPHPYAGDRAVAVALVELRGLRPTGRRYARLLDPRRPIPPEATRLHGLRDTDVTGQPALEEVLEELLGFIGEAVLVGHHIGFDLRLLNRALRQRALRPLPHPWVDTALLHLALTGRSGHASLEEVAAFWRIPLEGRHTAEGDARITAQLFARLAPRLVGAQARVGELIERQLERPGP